MHQGFAQTHRFGRVHGAGTTIGREVPVNAGSALAGASFIALRPAQATRRILRAVPDPWDFGNPRGLSPGFVRLLKIKDVSGLMIHRLREMRITQQDA